MAWNKSQGIFLPFSFPSYQKELKWCSSEAGNLHRGNEHGGGRDGAKWLRKTCSWSPAFGTSGISFPSRKKGEDKGVQDEEVKEAQKRAAHKQGSWQSGKWTKRGSLGSKDEALCSFPVGWEWGMTRCAGVLEQVGLGCLSGGGTRWDCIHALFSKALGWLILWKVKNNKLSNKQK